MTLNASDRLKAKLGGGSGRATTASTAVAVDDAPPEINWDEVSTELTRRCVLMEVHGDTDTGRSTFALSAPGPIAYLNGHEKVDGLMESMRATGKLVRAHRFGGVATGTADQVQSIAGPEMELFDRFFVDAFRWARTIIVDTHPEVWRWYQLNRLGTLTREGRDERDSRKGQLVYAEINNRWHNLFKKFRVEAARTNRVNLILVGETKDEYKEAASLTGKSTRQATGKTIPAGQKDTLRLCDIVVRTSRDKKGTFSVKIVKPWYNNDAREVEMSGGKEVLTFGNVLGVVTEMDPAEWEGER